MDRIAFKMKLNPGCVEEYKKRHDEIWPELESLLKESGISDYSIFFDKETNTLFAVQKQAAENTARDLKNNPIVQKWWVMLTDIMETNEDSSPVVTPLTEVFHLD